MKKYNKKLDNTLDSQLKCTAMVALMGEIFNDTQKKKNDWKMRMLKAGIPQGALSVPEDWDSLTEDEKEKRLNGAIDKIKLRNYEQNI